MDDSSDQFTYQKSYDDILGQLKFQQEKMRNMSEEINNIFLMESNGRSSIIEINSPEAFISSKKVFKEEQTLQNYQSTILFKQEVSEQLQEYYRRKLELFQYRKNLQIKFIEMLKSYNSSQQQTISSIGLQKQHILNQMKEFQMISVDSKDENQFQYEQQLNLLKKINQQRWDLSDKLRDIKNRIEAQDQNQEVVKLQQTKNQLLIQIAKNKIRIQVEEVKASKLQCDSELPKLFNYNEQQVVEIQKQMVKLVTVEQSSVVPQTEKKGELDFISFKNILQLQSYKELQNYMMNFGIMVIIVYILKILKNSIN